MEVDPEGTNLRRRTVWRRLLPVPALLVLLAVVLPLALGSRTLILRDVFNTHLPMKWSQAEAMKSGRLPLLDPHRSNGQPHLANPNTVALYPDNALYVVAPTVWALNAHFWIHLLIAPLAMYALARAWGIGRQGAWTAGFLYASSGYFLSTMNLYNLVAGASLAPALVAAVMLLSRRATAGRFAAAGGLWALSLLSGDPVTSALALALSVSAAIAASGWRATVGRPVLFALGCGTLVAAPQLVEFGRILSLSYRGYMGYTASSATTSSWNPATWFDALVPLSLGMPDLSYWGARFHQGHPPLLFTLAPGVVALLLLVLGTWVRHRRQTWAWSVVAVGVFFALGRFNPVVPWLLGLPGFGLIRIPVKFWLAVAIGLALLAGVGLERLRVTAGRKAFAIAGLVLAMVYGVVWFVFGPGEATAVEAWIPPEMSRPEELARTAAVALLSLTTCTVAVALLGWRRGGTVRRAWATGLLLALAVGSQLWLLRPLLVTDHPGHYRRPSPLLQHVPESSLVVHGDLQRLFWRAGVPADAFPDSRQQWVQRRAFAALYPAGGIVHGRRYELYTSPEGLDGFLTFAAGEFVRRAPNDAVRVRLLQVWGVDRLILGRPLDERAMPQVTELARVDDVGDREMRVYEVRDAAPAITFATDVRTSAHGNEAAGRMLSRDFDPARSVVLAGGEPTGDGDPGTGDEPVRLEVRHDRPEDVSVHVDSPRRGVLVLQRAYLPLYRASIDGRPATPVVANLHRIGVEVPAGTHEVRVWVDRSPLRISLLVSLLGVLGLAVLPHQGRWYAPPLK